MTSVAFAAARVARPPSRVNNGSLVPGARSRGKSSPARGAPARVRAEASASSDATASSRPPASSLSRRAALAAATASVASRIPTPDPALALVDDANAQRVFETAARSVVALADYVEGGPNGGYTPRGTAVVWSEFADGGFVITDFHVVAPYVARSAGASSSKKQTSSPGGAPPSARLRVNVPDARTGDAVWYEAQVVGTQRASDVAVLRLTSPEVRGAAAPSPRLTAMAVGSSDDLLVGQSCYAVGAGDTDDVAGARTSRQRTTMSAGVVSGLRRSVPSKNGTTIRNAIQTDAKVPESSAGGALVDSSGRLVGMTVTTYGSVSPGLSFAVPVDDLLKIVPSLITLHQIS